MSLRRKLSAAEQVEVEKQAQQAQTAQKLRETVGRFRRTFSLRALQSQLPLRFPSQAGQSLSFRALSWYSYPGWDELCRVKDLSVLSAFYIALHLIDFSPLRAELVALVPISLNGRGQTPFDPVSLFLCCLLRWEKGLGWRKLAELLAGPEGACWRRLFGFDAGCTPGASTMRTFYTRLDAHFESDLCLRFIDLLCAAGLLPQQATDAHGPARGRIAVAADGMLHEAHASMRCGQVTASCYQPTSPQAPRPCPAQEKGFDGCTCTDKRCAQRCRLTTPRDAEARLIHYSGSNQEGQEEPSRARNVYGYRSYAQVLCDDDLHTYWLAYCSTQAANTDERTIMPRDFAHLRHRLPALQIGEFVADAAVGYQCCLDPLYDDGVVPLIAMRRDNSDEDETACQTRGYDHNGYPLCAHGYRMSFNGLDYRRLRACWVCRQICAHQRPQQPQDADCPFRDPDRPLGLVTHVGRAFVHPDGSRHHRLARLLPYNAPIWKRHYGPRKNAVEARNSQLTRLGLKRIWSYGLRGATADIAFTDLLINLRNLGRLVQQATLLEP
jgi:hypothetical protein